MIDVVEVLKPVEARYYDIGMGLRLDMEYLDEIESKFDQDHSKALRKVVDAWLKQKYDVSIFGPPTWQLLVEVLDGLDDHELAKKVALDHPAG